MEDLYAAENPTSICLVPKSVITRQALDYGNQTRRIHILTTVTSKKTWTETIFLTRRKKMPRNFWSVVLTIFRMVRDYNTWPVERTRQ